MNGRHFTPQERVTVPGRVALPSGRIVTVEACGDLLTGLYAHTDYRTGLAVAKSVGAKLISAAAIREIVAHGITAIALLPDAAMKAATPRRPGETEEQYNIRLYEPMGSREWCDRADKSLRAQLSSKQWDGKTPALLNKVWREGAPAGRSYLMGMWDGDSFIQDEGPIGSWGPHNDRQFDYGTLLMLEWDSEAKPMARPTIKQGSKGEHVAAWQRYLGIKADGIFGPHTDTITRQLQRTHGLVADGIVGSKSWALAGEEWLTPAMTSHKALSPAVSAALRDANARWPDRRKQSDGTWGDLAHQARASDHNTGHAVDITHDPASGCDGELIAMLAIKDPRVSYVIWNRRIWNGTISSEWRPYDGSNAHTHHVHISVREDADGSHWPWAEVA